MKKIPRYTVYKSKNLSSDERKGALHWSYDSGITLCGRELDEHWIICDNNFEGEATCKKCLKEAESDQCDEEYTEIRGVMETRTAAFYDMSPDDQAEHIVSRADVEGLLTEDEGDDCGTYVFRVRGDYGLHNYTADDLRFLADELDKRNKITKELQCLK